MLIDVFLRHHWQEALHNPKIDTRAASLFYQLYPTGLPGVRQTPD